MNRILSIDELVGEPHLDISSLPPYRGLPDSLPGREDRLAAGRKAWRWPDVMVLVLIGLVGSLLLYMAFLEWIAVAP